ncbi:hypothetical protein KCP70_02265 [Salmonella enterica subsp. enterica]|nr:hypothetical protein KCP70_02265 [Salmonella enterica subsp. enterica]
MLENIRLPTDLFPDGASGNMVCTYQHQRGAAQRRAIANSLPAPAVFDWRRQRAKADSGETSGRYGNSSSALP